MNSVLVEKTKQKPHHIVGKCLRFGTNQIYSKALSMKTLFAFRSVLGYFGTIWKIISQACAVLSSLHLSLPLPLPKTDLKSSQKKNKTKYSLYVIVGNCLGLRINLRCSQALLMKSSLAFGSILRYCETSWEINSQVCAEK